MKNTKILLIEISCEILNWLQLILQGGGVHWKALDTVDLSIFLTSCSSFGEYSGLLEASTFNTATCALLLVM